MSPKFRAVVSGTLALALSTMGLAMAQSTTKTLSTNYTLVNLGSSTANVAADYQLSNGTVWHTASFTVTAGGQRIVTQYGTNPASPSTSGQGSLVLSSDQPMGAVVQILANFPGSGQVATNGAYAGFAGGSDAFYVPLVARKGSSASGQVNSQITIQNTGAAATVATITLAPLAGSTGSTVITQSLAPGQSWYFDLNSNIADGVLSTAWFGSATVTAAAGGSVAVVSNLFTGADTLQTYNGLSSGGTTLFAPSVFARLANGLSTPITIQNISVNSIAAGAAQLQCLGDTANTATPASFTLTNTTALASGASFAWNPVTNSNFPTGWFGSCKIVAPENVVSFVQVRTVGGTGIQAEAAAYESVSASSTDTQVIAPLMTRRLANGFVTVATIQNLTNVTNTVTVEYIPSAPFTTTLTFSVDIAPEGSLIQNLNTGAGLPGGLSALPAGWTGSMRATGAGAVAGFVQLRNVSAGRSGDTFMSHNMFTQP